MINLCEALPREAPRTFFEKKVLGTPKNFNVMGITKAIPFRKLFKDS